MCSAFIPVLLWSWSCVLSCERHFSLQWRHSERDDVSNQRRLDSLLKHLFRRRSKNTSKLCVIGLGEGNAAVTGGFPAQRASSAEMFPFDDVIVCMIFCFLFHHSLVSLYRILMMMICIRYKIAHTCQIGVNCDIVMHYNCFQFVLTVCCPIGYCIGLNVQMNFCNEYVLFASAKSSIFRHSHKMWLTSSVCDDIPVTIQQRTGV